MKVHEWIRVGMAFEAGMWRSLFRWITRRPVELGPTGEPFGHAGSVKLIMFAFIGVSVVEIPILHFLIPWDTIRIIALALGAYGLVWMIGLLASVVIHPHILDDTGIRIRNGMMIDARLSWESIDRIQSHSMTLPPGSRSVLLERSGDRVVLVLAVAGNADISVIFKEPTIVGVAKTKGEPVDEVRFSADDPPALISRARELMAARAATVVEQPAE